MKGGKMKLITYKGENLKMIKFLLGGIGTGSISLEGRGSLTDWEIFNRPSKGNILYGNFAVIKIIQKEPVIKILARKPFPPYEGSIGLQNLRMEGFPHFEEAEFINFFPFAFINFIERNFPLKITLSAYSPFIPLDEDSSSLPVAILKYKLKNLTRKKINLSIAFSMMNPVGTDGTEKLTSPYNKCFGKNTNIFMKNENFSGLLFTSKKYNEDDIRYGNIFLGSDSENVYYKNIVSIGWWNDFREFWNEFEKGKIVNNFEGETNEGQTLIGVLIIDKEIMPYEETDINFYISWYFPNRINYWGLDEEVKNKMLKNWYSKKFKSSIDVLDYFKKNEEYFENKSKKFAELFFSSEMPESFLNTISAQFQTLRSNTFLRIDDYFYGFEGCSDNSGCCPLNCTHVYNYEQTIAYLFPNLEKKMREVDYLYNVNENGYMAFRTNIPLGIKIWNFKPAADGQTGTILKVYREWKISGDNEFLKKIYPNLKKSVEFIWKEWDTDKDGLIEGVQHNTYDVEFYGPNPFTSFIYIASLKAMAEISKFMNDIDFSNICNEIYEKGKKNILSLWNGYYFIQKCNKEPLPPYQFLNGCLDSQLLGQAFSDILNLGSIVDEKYIEKTLNSILKFNFKKLSSHKNYMRIYALNEEEGILICTWPFKDRPEIPMPYCDEIWDGGEEFVICGLLLKRGRINEAKMLIEAIVERHDGIKRYPFNYSECGYHYARPLSCWFIVLNWSGFSIDNVEKIMTFKPLIFKKRFTLFFSSGLAWGNYGYSILPGRELFEIKIENGFIEAKEINLKFWKKKKTKNLKIEIDGERINDFKFEEKEGILKIKFESLKRSEREITITRVFI
jgi:non-lysosomal glucosylceramidase